MASLSAASALWLAPQFAGAQATHAATPVAPVASVHVVADPGVRVDEVRGGATLRLEHHEVSRCTRMPCTVLVGGAAGWGDATGVASTPWLRIGGEDGTSDLLFRRDVVDGMTVRVHRSLRLRVVPPLALTGVGLAAVGAGLFAFGMAQSPNGCPSGACEALRDGGIGAVGAGVALGVTSLLVYLFATPPRTSVERPAPPRIGFAPTVTPSSLGVGLTLRL